MGLEFLKNSNGKLIQVNVSYTGELILPLATISSPIPRYARDDFNGIYLHNVNGLPLLSLGFDMSPYFESHKFRWEPDNFLAISLRKRKDLYFISQPHEITAAIRELGFRIVS